MKAPFSDTRLCFSRKKCVSCLNTLTQYNNFNPMAGCMIEEHIVALVGLVQTIISKNIAKYFAR